jgi:hypothetical protein
VSQARRYSGAISIRQIPGHFLGEDTIIEIQAPINVMISETTFF